MNVAIFLLCFTLSFCLLKIFVILFHQKMDIYRTKKISIQLPLFLEHLRLGITAGHSFIQTLDLIIPQMPQPLRKELTHILIQLHQGKNASSALVEASISKLHPEFQTFSIIVGTLLTRGASLGHFLKKFERNMKYKLQTESKIQAETKQFLVQSLLCCSIPWIALLGYAFFCPTHLSSALSNPWVQKLFVISLILNMCGFYFMKHMKNKVLA